MTQIRCNKCGFLVVGAAKVMSGGGIFHAVCPTRVDFDQQVAERIHDKTCHVSHIDQCDWGYSSWINPNATRKDYLARARSLIALVGEDTALEAVSSILTSQY